MMIFTLGNRRSKISVFASTYNCKNGVHSVNHTLKMERVKIDSARLNQCDHKDSELVNLKGF